MKKIFILLLTVLISAAVLTACMARRIVHIDWVDFVKWDGVSFERVYNDESEVIVPSESVGDRVGFVAKNAPSEVSDPNYKPEDGMASFLPVGTEFFKIKGYDSDKYIAVYTDGEYILYKDHESQSISFNDVDVDSDGQHETAGLQPTRYETVNNFKDVTMTIKEGTISSTGLKLMFNNNSESQCTYGEYFILETKLNQKWYEVPVVIEGDYGFNDIGYELAPGGSGEWTVDWEWLYGSLAAGEYRIVKDILDFRETGDYDTYYLASEFTIN